MMWQLAVIVVAAAALLIPVPSSSVEHLYAQGVFPRLQSALTSFSNLTSFAWLDLLIAVTFTGIVAATVYDLRTTPLGRATVRVIVRLLTIASVAYLVFLTTWGFNYRRSAMRERLSYSAARVSPDAAASLARETVIHLNGLYAGAHQSGWQQPLEIDRALEGAFEQAAQRIGLPHRTTVGRPKHSLLDLYFRRAGVAGMTDPYFLETIVASDVLPFERPSVIAHEWSHLAGLTDEGEANFLGWLACLRGTVPHQYSGWLFLYAEVIDGLPRESARTVSEQLAAGPRSDLQAIRQRSIREVSPHLAQAGWRVYDRYLKANRVEAGTASYAEVVQLILGTGVR